MKLFKRYKYLVSLALCIIYASCKLPVPIQVPTLKSAPAAYANSTDSTNSADMKWREFFTDPNLIALIDTAINNNPEMLMLLQDIEMANNKIQMRHGALLPSVSVGGGMGIEKVGTYTSQGAGDASADITEGHKVPENLTDFSGGSKLGN
jgi:outer membrane protein, multidrug efflux system